MFTLCFQHRYNGIDIIERKTKTEMDTETGMKNKIEKDRLMKEKWMEGKEGETKEVTYLIKMLR